MDNPLEPPKKSTEDDIHTVVKAAISAIPAIGGPAAEFFVNFIVPPIEKRKVEWMESVTEKIINLELNYNEFKKENLKKNELFIDTVVTTTKTILSNGSEIKKEKLLNALQNVALEKITDVDKCSIFLNLIDRFSNAHINIFTIFADPEKFREKRDTSQVHESPMELIKKHAGGVDTVLIKIIVDDLNNYGLITINSERLKENPSALQMPSTYLTELGNEFISFISSPIS